MRGALPIALGNDGGAAAGDVAMASSAQDSAVLDVIVAAHRTFGFMVIFNRRD
jgi:hypothetical protein